MPVVRPDSAPATPGRQRLQYATTALAAALALAVVGAPARAPALTRTPSATPVVTPGPSTVVGRVATDGIAAGCTGGRPGVTVLLEPAARSVVTSATGEFVFDDVSHGEYTLRVEPDCEPIPCYAPYRFFHARDTAITLCYEDCPATLTVEPVSGRPGSVADLSGYCYTGIAGRGIEVYFDDEHVASTIVDPAGVYGTSFVVPAGAEPFAAHAVRVVVDGDELARSGFDVEQGPAPCIGDCDGDFAVTIDELVRGIGVALGSPTGDCEALDGTGDGRVTVAELVAAVGRALDGCHAADLVPITARVTRCVESCEAPTEPRLFMDVCLANRGDFDATFFNVQQEGPPRAGAAVFGLAAGAETCVELPFAGDSTVVVDYYRVIPERDETNNVLPVAVGTACDVVGPPCTPTQTPRPTPT